MLHTTTGIIFLLGLPDLNVGLLLATVRLDIILDNLLRHLGDTEELVHALERHTLIIMLVVGSDAVAVIQRQLTLVSGMKNQVKTNMAPAAAAKKMKAP